MSTATRLLILLPTWILIAFTTAWILRRRGHEFVTWFILGLACGPLVIPLAVDKVRRSPRPNVRRIRDGRPGAGHLDVLVGVDRLPCNWERLQAAVAPLGPSIRRLTVAHVVSAEEQDMPEVDEDAIGELCPSGVSPSVIVLSGEPAVTLTEHARREAYDVLVVDAPEHGAGALMFGSAARRLARGSDVTVVIAPRQTPDVMP